MSYKSRRLVAQLFESRFKGSNAIRQILDNPTTSSNKTKRSSLNKTRKRRRGNYVKGVHKGNFFRIRLPSNRKLPNLPKLPPSQPMPKATTPLAPPQTTAEATEAILQSHAAGGSISTVKVQQQGSYYQDFVRRLAKWFQENWAVLVLNCGSICTLTGFTRSDILELRTLSMTGSIASAIYLLAQPRILWASISWSSLFASVNAYKIFRILEERTSEVHMNQEQEDMYVEYFLPHGITPKQFERIEQKATKIELKKGGYLVRKGDKLENVYLIVKGRTKAHILGRHITAMTRKNSFDEAASVAAGDQKEPPPKGAPPVKSGAWVGEMAFMDYYWDREHRKTNNNAPQGFAGRESFYTIMALEDCEILQWSHEEMSDLMSSSNDMRSALTRAMTSALVSKVVQMTVSKTKQMPTWSTWLADWAHNAGADVKVNQVAGELPGALRAASGTSDNNNKASSAAAKDDDDSSDDDNNDIVNAIIPT